MRATIALLCLCALAGAALALDAAPPTDAALQPRHERRFAPPALLELLPAPTAAEVAAWAAHRTAVAAKKRSTAPATWRGVKGLVPTAASLSAAITAQQKAAAAAKAAKAAAEAAAKKKAQTTTAVPKTTTTTTPTVPKATTTAPTTTTTTTTTTAATPKATVANVVVAAPVVTTTPTTTTAPSKPVVTTAPTTTVVPAGLPTPPIESSAAWLAANPVTAAALVRAPTAAQVGALAAGRNAVVDVALDNRVVTVAGAPGPSARDAAAQLSAALAATTGKPAADDPMATALKDLKALIGGAPVAATAAPVVVVGGRGATKVVGN